MLWTIWLPEMSADVHHPPLTGPVTGSTNTTGRGPNPDPGQLVIGTGLGPDPDLAAAALHLVAPEPR